MTESMDIRGILEHLPQRYPFLMIDRVLECEPGQRILAIKNVSANEPCFLGHFPGRPIFPGVLILPNTHTKTHNYSKTQTTTIFGHHIIRLHRNF